ncbi:hypothetical protein T265_01207 [Opisthorchis viverrini]|uniref:Uncharacterized protein n=1 Tax=Opisthorchis viverrini TaxID=6198 RepID=A0A074ZZ57_OPIVI|nr:hypothetical protein T265_01207 [Opisthorchis viverrini]KER32718.1 hypothetical protein T265_01207 [Opisthorchis viverrini]
MCDCEASVFNSGIAIDSTCDCPERFKYQSTSLGQAVEIVHLVDSRSQGLKNTRRKSSPKPGVEVRSAETCPCLWQQPTNSLFRIHVYYASLLGGQYMHTVGPEFNCRAFFWYTKCRNTPNRLMECPQLEQSSEVSFEDRITLSGYTEGN